MVKKRLSTLEDFEKEVLQNPDIRKEYAGLKPKYDIIERLIERRNQLCLSQAQLAKMVGMRQPAISRLERGDYNTTLGTLLKVAEALGLDLDVSSKTLGSYTIAEKRAKYSK